MKRLKGVMLILAVVLLSAILSILSVGTIFNQVAAVVAETLFLESSWGKEESEEDVAEEHVTEEDVTEETISEEDDQTDNETNDTGSEAFPTDDSSTSEDSSSADDDDEADPASPSEAGKGESESGEPEGSVSDEEDMELINDLETETVLETEAMLETSQAVLAMLTETPGVLNVGSERTVAEALEALTKEEVQSAGGSIIIRLEGDTGDTDDIVIPADLGIKKVTVTSADQNDYKMGSSPVSLFANGIPLTFQHGIVGCLYGGGINVSLKSTEIVMTGGGIEGPKAAVDGLITGGSLATNRNADISISGSCNITIKGVEGLSLSNIYSGSVTNAPGVTAKIGKTNLLIEDSEIESCLISGGSFMWSSGSGVVLDLGESNITIKNSTVTTEYLDFTNAIYGGHIGNRHMSDTKLLCDSCHITVDGSTINGEIFGGHYNGASEPDDTVVMGNVVIDLKDSSVCGIYGGGLYMGGHSIKATGTRISLTDCEVQDSHMLDTPAICGGNVYWADDAEDEQPPVNRAEINLNGDISDNCMIAGEGIGISQTGNQQVITSITPGYEVLSMTSVIAGKLPDAINVDSGWNQVSIRQDNGHTEIIDTFQDYADLIDQIKNLLEADSVVSSNGAAEQAVDENHITTDELPDDLPLSQEEIKNKKTEAVDALFQTVAQTAESHDTPTLPAAVKTLNQALQSGETAEVYLKQTLTEVKLTSRRTGGDITFVPASFTLEIEPYLLIRDAHGSPKNEDILSNDQLNGNDIEFLIGVPDTVTMKYANVTHYGEVATDSYQTEIKKGAGGQYILLHTRSFSTFEITFTNVRQKSNSVKAGTRDSGYTDGGTASTGKWVRNQTGWWYDYGNDTWPSNEWKYISGSWYRFNPEGYMVTGWYLDPLYSKWFYLCDNGAMAVGWLQIDGVWYYFETRPGACAGRLYTNERTPDGYEVNSDGAWIY